MENFNIVLEILEDVKLSDMVGLSFKNETTPQDKAIGISFRRRYQKFGCDMECFRASM